MIAEPSQIDITQAGELIFNRIVNAGWDSPVGSDTWTYGQTVRSAMHVLTPDEVYALLVRAEGFGKRLKLTYGVPIETHFTHPSGVILV